MICNDHRLIRPAIATSGSAVEPSAGDLVDGQRILQQSQEFNMRPLSMTARVTALTVPALLTFAGIAAADTNVASAGAVQLAQSTVIVAPTAPPPVREEAPPPPPTATAVTQVWETGHWVWNGGNWEWVHGQYVVRPATVSPTAAWQPGHWLQQPNGWVWIEGSWQ
jgi:hypothetical protein